VLCWDSAEAAQAGAAVLGPTWFNEHVFPHLLGEQERTGGEAIVAVMEGGAERESRPGLSPRNAGRTRSRVTAP